MDRAVSRSFQILESLAQASGPLRLSAVAAQTGLQKSTVHRILGTLCELGYAQQEESGLYAASLKTWELGAGVIADLPIKRVASGYLQTLHRDTGETVNLTVLVGDDVLYLDKIIAPRPVRFSTRVGSRVAAPLTSGGKAMLARLVDAPERLARIATRRTLDVDALLAELDEVRARGYAVSGYSPGVVSTGAAVIGPGHAPIAALSVSAPRERLDAAKSKAIAEAVLETCARMAEAVNRP